MQNLHSAQKTLTDLREHLARHDKPIAFLFGAGTSCSVRVDAGDGAGNKIPLIPAVAELTKRCQADASDLGKIYADAWPRIGKLCNVQSRPLNIEDLLSRLRTMLESVGEDDKLCGLNRDEIKTLEESVRKTIAKVVAPSLEGLPDDFPHRKLARWLARTSRQSPVEIFTVNYDVLLEHALEAERVPVFDGFVGALRPFFHPDSLRRQEAAPGSNWIRLWKMHGSVSWQRIEHAGRHRVVRGEVHAAGEMILPSFQKYDESRQQPYSAFSGRLTRFLEQDDALLISAGFNFGDEHINDLIFDALDNKPRTHLYALQFEDMPESCDLVRRALNQRNMIVIEPEIGTLGGERYRWDPEENLAFASGLFDVSDEPSAGGEPVDGSSEPKVGRMRIGDFSQFCEFLESMAAG